MWPATVSMSHLWSCSSSACWLHHGVCGDGKHGLKWDYVLEVNQLALLCLTRITLFMATCLFSSKPVKKKKKYISAFFNEGMCTSTAQAQAEFSTVVWHLKSKRSVSDTTAKYAYSPVLDISSAKCASHLAPTKCQWGIHRYQHYL